MDKRLSILKNIEQTLSLLYSNTKTLMLYIYDCNKESQHNTYYRGEGEAQSLGSRSLYMRLEAGDTISLRTGQLGHGLFQITLCFELAQFDYAPPV